MYCLPIINIHFIITFADEVEALRQDLGMPEMPAVLCDSNHKGSGIGFAGVLVLTVLVTMLLVMALNFVVDPFGIFGTGLYPIVSSNRYSQVRELLEVSDPPPEALIIGSSRVVCIEPDQVENITNLTSLNCWGPAATPEIYYATIRMALEEYHVPVKMIVVGVEPGVLIDNGAGIHAQASILYSYEKYFSSQPVLATGGEMLARLVSGEHTQVSLGRLNVFFPNFTHSSAEVHTSGLDAGINADIKRYSTFWDAFIKAPISESRKYYWDKFLRICSENEIEVFAFTLPAHPRLVDRFFDFGSDENYVRSAEYLEKSVLDMGGTFRLYYVPQDFGGNDDDFRDGVHMTSENGRLLLIDLLSEKYDTNG